MSRASMFPAYTDSPRPVRRAKVKNVVLTRLDKVGFQFMHAIDDGVLDLDDI